jgi:hypothetical protein
MASLYLSPARRMRVLSGAVIAASSLYMVLALVAEPTRTFAATTANIAVDVTIPSTLAVSCTSTVSLGNLAAGSAVTGSGTCTPITNGSLGYTLKWNITSGSGGYGTGHLNSYIKNTSTPGGNGGYQIRAMGPTTGGTPQTFTTIAHGCVSCAATDVRWAARLRAGSTTTGGAAMPDFGADTAQTFLNIGTGSAVSITKSSAPTAIAGDSEYIQFKAIAGSSNVNAATTYKATVIMSVVNN